ncbi:regulator of cell morphogenesis and NO signaling [Oceanobacillus limi]|uniref:Regulator of cell morphogenesis and NO signaling n=1 Tax=Oceanobacillus limi TaxID=930131 RepID=A0A1I0D998_9BACI|nr:iron-sulfur cluster repair di-iron protein [Oceanobacillus limi]SET28650.1 regulator of cell morphogenesis and NO signaling [Oceanobacillus limi]
MNIFTAEHTPAEVVKAFPKASDLFKQYKIDFCCGGDQSLASVFLNKDLKESTILNELNTAYKKWQAEDHELTNWDDMALSQLIDHIVNHHHRFLEEELAPLSQFVTKIYKVHGEKHPHLKELHRLYHELKVELEEHTMKEEAEVFPLIKTYENQPTEDLLHHIHVANGTLEDEHDHAGALLKQIREITNDFTPPSDACNSYRITYARLADLESDTFQHIHLENNVLFHRL